MHGFHPSFKQESNDAAPAHVPVFQRHIGLCRVIQGLYTVNIVSGVQYRV